MTIQEVISSLQSDKQLAVPSRFPCRAIMVSTIAQYCALLSELKKISDIRIVQVSELFSSADVMPKYENLTDMRYQNEWIVLTGVSEYLRLFSKNEAVSRRFSTLWSSQKPAISTGRIIIPLWGCESQWYDKTLNLTSDIRQEEFYFDCTDTHDDEQKMNLLVLSGVFEEHLDKVQSIQAMIKIGMQEWFEYWQNPSRDVSEFVLLTKRCNSVVSTTGSVSVRVMKDILSFIKERMPGAEFLTVDNCSVDMQNELFEYALKGSTLDNALLHSLNMSEFSGVDIMGKWKALPMSHREFAALWLKLHPDNTYLSHCFNRCDNIHHLADSIRKEIFSVRLTHPEWVSEFQQLAAVMDIQLDAEYFEQLDLIPVYETRLDFIVGASREIRIYLLHMVGKWLREDPSQVFSSSKLQNAYPELFAYLCHSLPSIDNDLMQYLTKYRSYKLENTLPCDESVYFSDVQTDLYDYRFSLLSTAIDDETIVLWIDALGIEWAQLLVWSLQRNCDATIKSVSIAQATLPTETSYNDQWNHMGATYHKLDKLDKLAHKGVVDEPDYYACIEEQIAFVNSLHKQIAEMMKSYRRVIITGDHGTSRLAARFFHVRDGFDAPPGAKVCSHGRYCILDDHNAIVLPDMQIINHPDGTRYAVFANYDHFKQSGFAAGMDDDNAIFGEVHGGASPEEMLVPVIVVESNQAIPLTASLDNTTVKIRLKKAKLLVRFNKSVGQLSAQINGVHGQTLSQNNSQEWTISFVGIKPGTYALQICADNQIVTLPDVTILPALGNEEGDLP